MPLMDIAVKFHSWIPFCNGSERWPLLSRLFTFAQTFNHDQGLDQIKSNFGKKGSMIGHNDVQEVAGFPYEL